MSTLLLIALLAVAPADIPQTLSRAALSQVGVTRVYDPAYVQLVYPNGDIPIERGVCADVIIRAFRAAGIDLQVAVHQDMAASFRAYPSMWGLHRPDRNIDHRRVPNLMRFFERKGKSLPASAAFAPGDVVAWMLPGGLYHIGLVSAVRDPSGKSFLVVHNIGYGAKNEDVLHAFRIIGHYRW